MCAPRIGKNIGTRGSYMSFEACESRILMHSVPLPRLGIAGAVCFEMSYFIDFQLFRKKIFPCITDYSYYSCFLRGVIILIIYITIYILISYRVYKEGIPLRFLTVITVIVIAGLFTSLQGPSKPFGSSFTGTAPNRCSASVFFVKMGCYSNDIAVDLFCVPTL